MMKHIVDIWVYMKKFEKLLDWEYVEAELEKLELKAFTYRVFELTKVWFENKTPDETDKAMEEYILLSGVYGNTSNVARSDKMVAKNKLWYSLQQYYKVAFAKREHLEEIFPNLKKYPYLLWYYRIKRIILKLTDGSGAKYIENQRTVSSARINETEQHFNAVGLEDYLK